MGLNCVFSISFSSLYRLMGMHLYMYDMYVCLSYCIPPLTYSPHPHSHPSPHSHTHSLTHSHMHKQMSQNHAPGTPPASMAMGMATSNHPVGYRTLGNQQQQFSSLSGHSGGVGTPQQPGGNSSMTPSTPVHHQPPTPSVR